MERSHSLSPLDSSRGSRWIWILGNLNEENLHTSKGDRSAFNRRPPDLKVASLIIGGKKKPFGQASSGRVKKTKSESGGGLTGKPL